MNGGVPTVAGSSDMLVSCWLCLLVIPCRFVSTFSMESKLQKLQDIIGTDAGGRGMKHLLCPGDLSHACHLLGSLPASSTVVILSGFPCCIDEDPPTETDGPPGALALVRCSAALGHNAVLVTDECNRKVFAAALGGLVLANETQRKRIRMECFPPEPLCENDETRLLKLQDECQLLISCERAGPATDGICYTMRALDMNARGLIAPLHRLVQPGKYPFIGIGDGGNELGMGKVYDKIVDHIPRGSIIGCHVAANHMIAASVSNWGGYALAAGAALVRSSHDDSHDIEYWVNTCLPSPKDERELLDRCVAVGCRDGVSGKVEATVDGMPLETSLLCLEELRQTVLEK